MAKKIKLNKDTINSIKEDTQKDGLKLLTTLLTSVLVVMFLTLSLFVGVISTNEKMMFFGVDEKGDFAKLVDLNGPNHKTSVVANWVAEALISTFDFNYKNMSDHLNKESKNWFTSSGSIALINSLDSSNYFGDIIDKKAIVQLTILQNPIYVKDRVNKETGKFEWIFQVPVIFTYIVKDSDPLISNALFTLSVERISFADNAKGLGINKLLITK
jgi:hypothetical protein